MCLLMKYRLDMLKSRERSCPSSLYVGNSWWQGSKSGLSRIYNFRTDRCHNNAAELLKDYHGVLHSDKYGAYEALACKKAIYMVSLLGSHTQKIF